jgi:hypothetical protein
VVLQACVKGETEKKNPTTPADRDATHVTHTPTAPFATTVTLPPTTHQVCRHQARTLSNLQVCFTS